VICLLLCGICFIIRSDIPIYVCVCVYSFVFFMYSDCVCGRGVTCSISDPFFQCGV
jgi:hypothetical protein